jgi:hypothetical protein
MRHDLCSIRCLLNLTLKLKFKLNRIILNGMSNSRWCPRKPVSGEILEIWDEKKTLGWRAVGGCLHRHDDVLVVGVYNHQCFVSPGWCQVHPSSGLRTHAYLSMHVWACCSRVVFAGLTNIFYAVLSRPSTVAGCTRVSGWSNLDRALFMDVATSCMLQAASWHEVFFFLHESMVTCVRAHFKARTCAYTQGWTYSSYTHRLAHRFPFSAADRSSDQFAPRETLAPCAIQFPFVVLALQVVADIFACVRFGPSGADHMCW